MKIALLLVTLVSLAYAGPFAAAAWATACSGCISACMISIPGTPAYIACIALCCGAAPAASLLLCFDEDTTFDTDHGILPATQVSSGMKAVTLKNGKQEWTQILGVVKSSEGYDFLTITTPNNTLTVTLDHLMVEEAKLVKAQNLKIGMMLGGQRIEKL
jgi:hypothetical protein